MKKFKYIFKQPKPLSLDEIKKYLSGRLNTSKKHLLEQKLNADPFAAEAFEAFEQNPELCQIDLKNPYIQFSNYIYKAMFFTAIIITGVIITYLLLQTDNQKSTTSTIDISNQTIQPNTPLTVVTDSVIENTQEIEPKEQINYKQTINNRPQTVIAKTPQQTTITIYQNNPKITDIEPIEKKEPEITVPANATISKSNVKFTYIHDLKVIDYSNIYTANIPVNKFTQLTGTPANLADKNENTKNEHEAITVYIPYEEFLKETLLDFKNGNYKSFLKNSNIILKHYPDDLNAYFYGGLSLYNLNRCENAIIYFDKCINAAYNTFYQEAMWYKALSLLRCNKQTEAEILLREIISQNGFYTDQARKKLNEIK
jgi:tetratricopeptide (TPR) repeat protein